MGDRWILNEEQEQDAAVERRRADDAPVEETLTGQNETSAVTVHVTNAAQLESIKLAADWQKSLDPRSVDAAVLSAANAATMRAVAGQVEAYEQDPEGQAERYTQNEQSPAAPDATPITAQDAIRLVDEVNADLDRFMRQVSAAAQHTAEIESGGQHITDSGSRGQVTHLSVDPNWAASARKPEIQNELLEVFQRVQRETALGERQHRLAHQLMIPAPGSSPPPPSYRQIPNPVADHIRNKAMNYGLIMLTVGSIMFLIAFFLVMGAFLEFSDGLAMIAMVPFATLFLLLSGIVMMTGRRSMHGAQINVAAAKQTFQKTLVYLVMSSLLSILITAILVPDILDAHHPLRDFFGVPWLHVILPWLSALLCGANTVIAYRLFQRIPRTYGGPVGIPPQWIQPPGPGQQPPRPGPHQQQRTQRGCATRWQDSDHTTGRRSSP